MATYTQSHREGKKALEELGYHEVGFAGGHLVMEHPYAGRLYVSGSPATIEGEVARKQQKARRAIAQVSKNVEGFVEYLRKKYNVPEDSSVVVQTAMQKEIRLYGDKIHERLPASLAKPVTTGGYVKMIQSGNRQRPSTLEIFGAQYTPATDDKPEPTNADLANQSEATLASKSEPVCGAQHPQYKGVGCTLPPEHEGAHSSEAVESDWYSVGMAEIEPELDRPQLKAEAKIYPKPSPPVEKVRAKTAAGPQEIILSEATREELRKLLFPEDAINKEALRRAGALVEILETQLDDAYATMQKIQTALNL